MRDRFLDQEVKPEPTASRVTDGWRQARGEPSLREVWGSIPVAGTGWRKLLAFLGPGYLVSVGYMDPGNWATSLAGGAIAWVHITDGHQIAGAKKGKQFAPPGTRNRDGAPHLAQRWFPACLSPAIGDARGGRFRLHLLIQEPVPHLA